MLLAQELAQIDKLVFAVNTSLAVSGSGVTLRGTLRYFQLLCDTPQAVPLGKEHGDLRLARGEPIRFYQPVLDRFRPLAPIGIAT